ncbi:MAG: hypothetical protein E5W82_27415 [Mesorhizobium sp.]|nr:MAG: hypothetical protein E5W82_27415 [Mesorhizobium sp.]
MLEMVGCNFWDIAEICADRSKLSATGMVELTRSYETAARVQRTIERDLPDETLRRYDQFRQHVDAFIDMPELLTDLLFRFLHQNGCRLSNRAPEKEFAALTDGEAERTEAIYQQTFGSD